MLLLTAAVNKLILLLGSIKNWKEKPIQIPEASESRKQQRINMANFFKYALSDQETDHVPESEEKQKHLNVICFICDSLFPS